MDKQHEEEGLEENERDEWIRKLGIEHRKKRIILDEIP